MCWSGYYLSISLDFALENKRQFDGSVGGDGDAGAVSFSTFSNAFAHSFACSLARSSKTYIFADLFNRAEILIWDMKTKTVFDGKSTYSRYVTF